MTPSSAADTRPSHIHLPSLLVALVIMIAGTLYPPLMADSLGRADHGLATLLFWAMSAGFIRGVGFIPRATIWRWLFSGWACCAALLLAGVIKLAH